MKIVLKYVVTRSITRVTLYTQVWNGITTMLSNNFNQAIFRDNVDRNVIDMDTKQCSRPICLVSFVFIHSITNRNDLLEANTKRNERKYTQSITSRMYSHTIFEIELINFFFLDRDNGPLHKFDRHRSNYFYSIKIIIFH